MTNLASITLTLALSFCCLALYPAHSAKAQHPTAQPACGNTAGNQSPDFRTFRQLASPAINDRNDQAQSLHTAPQSAAPDVSRVSQASHSENTVASAKSAQSPKRTSPPASRIPAEIFVDPDVATIRLLSVSQAEGEVPSHDDEPSVRRTATPTTRPTAPNASAHPPANTQRPIPHSVVRKSQLQSNSLLTRILDPDTAKNLNTSPGILPNVQTEPICAANNAPAMRTHAEPFSTLANQNRERAWDISTRRPKNTAHTYTGPSNELQDVAAADRRLQPIKDIAPLPQGKIEQASATEVIPERLANPATGQTFWTQPQSFAPTPLNEPAKLKTIASSPSSVAKGPATAEAAPQAKVAKEAAAKVEEGEKGKVATGKWATMPIPGRASDYPTPENSPAEPQEPAVPAVPAKPKWAGLFVHDASPAAVTDERKLSKSELMQISFDAPIADTALPGEIMLTQAEKAAEKTGDKTGDKTPAEPRRRSRLRLDFLDDPDEKNSDPTQDAIRAILGEDSDDEANDLRSILDDDLETDQRSHREKYSYAYEKIEPKPIVKSPRNYAPTLKDILSEQETDPWVEQAYCDAVWRCAGGRDRGRLSQLNEQLDRNKQVFGGGPIAALAHSNSDNFVYNGNSGLPWGISPTIPHHGRGRLGYVTPCRVIRGGGWCTGACGGHCDVGCKVVCPKTGGSCSCTGDSCDGSCTGEGGFPNLIETPSCTGEGEVADAIEAACTE